MDNLEWTISDSRCIAPGLSVELVFRNRLQVTQWRVRLIWDDGLQVTNITTTDQFEAGRCFENTAREYGELLAS
ncbi:MAG: hypothetical protein CME81_05245 [Halomonas sp.]|nr:hypothetical protein [Halomonas sp.]|tara:strand:- start:208 stop:429 length:222 start_codon:yes stop_codon:yes gene_type:complete